MDDMNYSYGADAITFERLRQMDEEGFTAESDDQYNNHLVLAAMAYVVETYKPGTGFDWWPWDPEWWKPENKVKNLVKAGALIAAELDRLGRSGETLD